MKTAGSLKLFGCELISPNSNSKPMQNCSNAGQATQGNIAQATSQIPRRGRRDFAVLCKKISDIVELDQPDLRNTFTTNRKGDTNGQTFKSLKGRLKRIRIVDFEDLRFFW